MGKFSRRVGAAGTALVAMALVVAGCSSPDDDKSDSSGLESITIEHEFGSTTIDSEPQVVVTMLGSWTDALVALDVPIRAEYVTEGYAGENNKFEWTPAHESEVIPYLGAESISVPQLAAIEPDIILAGYLGSEDEYKRLRQVAPVIPVMQKDAVMDSWQDVTLTAGKIFGKQDQAQSLVDDAEQQVTDFKTAHPNAQGKTFSFGQLNAEGQIGLIADENDPTTKLMTSMGFVLDPRIKEVAEGQSRVLVSAERTDLLDSDLLVLWPLGGDPAAFDALPGWANRTAVKSGATVFVNNNNASALSNPTVLSVPFALDLIAPAAEKIPA
ncbi:ABC transporter substrate-binding protein [Williamsia sp. 1135]|uniref:ABC transporter substrate-binding protein n=1 Tax=Williamsia sp. 1135 TaxID=1889262 RepID=UPI001F0A7F53|nr:ABC transporter substrate-binding protein [Williamsia sp. 1135]